MNPFARMNLSSAALRRGILVSSLALAAAGCVYTPDTNDVDGAEDVSFGGASRI